MQASWPIRQSESISNILPRIQPYHLAPQGRVYASLGTPCAHMPLLIVNALFYVTASQV
jgi:hypothetical protein